MPTANFGCDAPAYFRIRRSASEMALHALSEPSAGIVFRRHKKNPRSQWIHNDVFKHRVGSQKALAASNNALR
jgi:hypothetical protein